MKILRFFSKLFKKTDIQPHHGLPEKKARRLAYLLTGYMRDNLTSEEHDELDEWVGASDKNMRVFEELTDEDRIKKALALLNDNGEGLFKLLHLPKMEAV